MLGQAVRAGDERAVEDVLQHKEVSLNSVANTRTRDTPLHVAATTGHAAIVALLLEARADTGARNMFGDTPFHAAFRKGHYVV